MAFTTTTLADDNFKTIIKANGLGGETKETLLDASILSGATSSPNLSIAHLYYEILGSGNLTFFFDAETDEQLIEEFFVEGKLLLEAPEDEIATTMIVAPNYCEDIENFHCLYEWLVEALEDESKHWLVDDAAIDAKITPELFSGPPASTGLVTRESHAWWRYAAKVDGRPDLSTEDELLLNRDEEQTRVATTTERLIRTQAAHPREFHRVLDDGAAIAEAIADLDVQHLKPRVFRPRGPPPSKN